jgi:hypothetical protein
VAGGAAEQQRGRGREEDDGDLFKIFQKFKGFTVK